jgi:hypothetical protein
MPLRRRYLCASRRRCVLELLDAGRSPRAALCEDALTCSVVVD